MRILIVEDEPKTAAFLTKGLAEHGFVADVFANGRDGLRAAKTQAYDLAILDVMLPGQDGWTILRELRTTGSQMPVLFLTAKDTVADRVKGLELGADDYLVKPFAFSELLARVRTILRRGTARQPETVRVADLEIDLLKHKVQRDGRRLDQRLNAEPLARELAELATTFNGMLDRLEDSFARLSQFSGDIAHELRTPIHNLRGEIEVTLSRQRSDAEYRDVLGSCLEECGRLTQMVESLLFLARAEQPQTLLKLDDLHLPDELETLRAFYEAAAEEAGVTLVVESPSNLTLRADRALFQRALGNLLTNAAAHTPRGGTIVLRAASQADGILIEVADTGSGIAADHLPHVFDRLYRVDTARTCHGEPTAQSGDDSPTASTNGTGLGLAIVKSILELHSGTATIISTAGQGTIVRTEWPLRPN